jgi:hypothetical protein
MYNNLFLKVLLVFFSILQTMFLVIPNLGDIPQESIIKRDDLRLPLIMLADYSFVIWGVIMVLSIIYSSLYFFSNTSELSLNNKIAPYALGVFISGSIYTFISRFEILNILFALSLFPILMFLVQILILISSHLKEKTINYRLTKILFSIYCGWVSVLFTVSIASMLLNFGYTGFPLGEKFMSFIGLLIITLIVTVIYNKTKNNWYLTASVWGVIGILVNSVLFNHNEVFISSMLAIVLFVSYPFFARTSK